MVALIFNNMNYYNLFNYFPHYWEVTWDFKSIYFSMYLLSLRAVTLKKTLLIVR